MREGRRRRRVSRQGWRILVDLITWWKSLKAWSLN